jgi:hypothetical protein
MQKVVADVQILDKDWVAKSKFLIRIGLHRFLIRIGLLKVNPCFGLYRNYIIS